MFIWVVTDTFGQYLPAGYSDPDVAAAEFMRRMRQFICNGHVMSNLETKEDGSVVAHFFDYDGMKYKQLCFLQMGVD